MSDAWELDGHIRLSQLKDRQCQSLQSPGQQHERIERWATAQRVEIIESKQEAVLTAHVVSPHPWRSMRHGRLVSAQGLRGTTQAGTNGSLRLHSRSISVRMWVAMS